MLTFCDFQKIAFSLSIDTGDSARPFGEAADPWQREDLAAILPSVARAIGIHDAPAAPMRHWWERPRGHDKSSSAALLACAALAAAERPISVILAAADEGQAALIHEAASKLVRLNPVLDGKREAKGLGRGLLKVQERRILAPRSGASAEVITSDAPSSWGLRPDVLIVDELSHWTERAEKFWESLFSALGKRKTACGLLITNAGWRESWQWRLRERVRIDAAWRFSRLEGCVASWIPADLLAEQRRILPPLAFSRVWTNQWIDGAGDALRGDDVDRSIVLPGPQAPEQGWVYYAGLDLGISRDQSALAVVGGGARIVPEPEPEQRPALPRSLQAMIDLGYLDAAPAPRRGDEIPDFIDTPAQRTLKLVHLQAWASPPGGKVSLSDVEGAVRQAHARYRCAFWFDPHQAQLLAERCRASGISMHEVPFTGSNLALMASALLERFASSSIELFPDEALLGDLRRLKIIVRNYGYRLDSARGPTGHGDRATALALAVLGARRCPPRPGRVAAGDLIIDSPAWGVGAGSFEENCRRLRSPEWWEG